MLLGSGLRSAAWKHTRTLFIIPGCRRQKGLGPFPNTHMSCRPSGESTRQFSAFFVLKKELCLCDSQVEQVIGTTENTEELQVYQTLNKWLRWLGKKSLPFTACHFSFFLQRSTTLKKKKPLNIPEGCEILCRKHWGLIKS